MRKEPLAQPASAIPTSRLDSLDAFRGFIMFTLMLGGIFHTLEEDPRWHWLATHNEHVAWTGCVYWDLIQPSFMYMVGVAMALATARRTAQGQTPSQQVRHAFLRAFSLIALGIVMDQFGEDHLQIGFIRVLQQIALSYLLAYPWVGRGWRVQACVAIGILIGYQLLWMYNPWNGPGGPWAMGNENLGSALDRWLLGRNYSGFYVGLNAVPATATLLFGVMAGQWVRPPANTVTDRTTSHSPHRVLFGLGVAGLIGIAFGTILGIWFPIIKRIWTPSFTILAAGWSTLMLALFYAVIDVFKLKRWAYPLIVVGSNSIVAYVLGNITGGWFSDLTYAWIAGLRAPLGDIAFPILQHGVIAICQWMVLWWLYRRKIFIKL